jgi:hypothetical protein
MTVRLMTAQPAELLLIAPTLQLDTGILLASRDIRRSVLDMAGAAGVPARAP